MEEPTDAGEQYVIQKLLKLGRPHRGFRSRCCGRVGSSFGSPWKNYGKMYLMMLTALLRSEVASVGSVETEPVPEKTIMTSFKCDLDHGSYQLGVVYKKETNAKYCKMGCYLFEVECSSCGK